MLGVGCWGIEISRGDHKSSFGLCFLACGLRCEACGLGVEI